MNRQEAIKLLDEYVKNENLKKHMYAVEAAMREYAEYFGADPEWWGLIGLLHDFDYEKYPTAEEHPYKGSEILKKLGYPEDFRKTILAHASHTNEPRDTQAKKAIYAVDELCGLIVAVALVKPDKKLSSVDVKSVKKKIKDKAFARQVNRQEIIVGAEELGLSLDQHIELTLKGIKKVSEKLNL